MIHEQFQWDIAPTPPSSLFEQFPEHPAIVVKLLANRKITESADVEQFLQPDYRQDQHDPYLFRDMQIVVDRIVAAKEAGEKVVIHGDYDADGVCASAVMFKTLQEIGIDAQVFLPHRDTEGYGLNMNTVDKLHAEGVDLIITVDCGVSNAPEVARAAELGMDVIVTDHHSQPPELPEKAIAVLNPKLVDETYPFEFLAGVGVSFKVCQALIQKFELGEAFEKWLLDIVAISTVTDFMPLIGENRVFVRYGLVVLRKNRRMGLQKLFDVMGVDPADANTTTIGFKVGPHINAAGRINHANMALKLMVEEDPIEATAMAQDLARTNKERQALSRKIADAATAQVEEQRDEQILIAVGDTWPVGLVGLVAGKISNQFGKPTFVITKMGEEIVGSGRSIEQFHLVEALQSMDDLFSKYGGHPMACGFSLKGEEQLDAFISNMRARAKELLEGADLRKRVMVEAPIRLKDANWDLIDTVEQFAPFGEGNPEPVFLSTAVEIVEISAVGKTKDHLRFKVQQEGTKRPAIAFGLGHHADYLKPGDKIDCIYTIDVNEWNGNREIQLMVQDIRETDPSVNESEE